MKKRKAPTEMAIDGHYVGRGVNRVDGRLKVTGAAQYAAEEALPGLLHGVLVGSPIARGRVVRIDVKAARALPGVVAVITHENRGKLRAIKPSNLSGMPDSVRPPLDDDEIAFVGQYVALVVAETLQQAQEAARCLAVEYRAQDFAFTLETAGRSAKPKKDSTGEPLQLSRGKPEKALAKAAVRVDATYETPCEHPTPMEPHATIAHWSNGKLTVRDATQWPYGDRGALARTFDLPPEDVDIVAPFIGGMFGCKAITGGHVILTALAAQKLDRPVKTVLTREQVLTAVGHRSRTVQRFELGAERDGKLTAMRHTTTSQTSLHDDYPESTSLASRVVYAPPHYEAVHEMKRVASMQPSWMRAPGEAPGQYAQECAMDELAVKLGIDPVELRRINDTQVNAHNGLPFSGRHLLACLDRGAARFGWAQRRAQPGSVRDGRLLVGQGMAVATYPGFMMGATAAAQLLRVPDGVRLRVRTAASDVGTGLYTVISAVAAEALGLPIEHVTAELGRSKYPRAAMAGGSNLTASLSPAVFAACRQLRDQLAAALVGTGGPFAGRDASELTFADGVASLGVEDVPYADILDRLGRTTLDADSSTLPIMGENGKHAFQSFGAVFAEVTVDPDLHMVRTRRLTAVYDAGRIMNPKTARSQLMGGLIFGLGMALSEELVPDAKHGRFINADFADYLIPVHADMPTFDIDFIDEPDFTFNPIGCRGVGELGNPGTAAAIANAVYNATGKRVRALPITPDKLMATPVSSEAP